MRISIIREIEQRFPCFSRMRRAQKRELIRQVSSAMTDAQKSESWTPPSYTKEELLGLEPLPANVMTVSQISRFIEEHHRTVLRLESPTRRRAIEDPLLKKLDRLLEDPVLDRLLATPGMTPGKRTWMPSRLLRMELLRTFRFGSWSVREFCKYISSLARKEERAFCRLPLNRLEMCDHSRLSAFRSSMTFEMRLNLTSYFLYHFFKSGRLGDSVIHMVDSTDISMPIKDTPLEKFKVEDGTFIRFYSDLNSDAGARRRKRNKSNHFVGYRVHTICVGDMKSGIAFPLVSLAAAACHNDSLFLEPLVNVTQLLGLEIQILTADEAYVSAPRQEKFRKEYGIITTTPPSKIALRPENTDKNTGAVYHDEHCKTPMRWRGYDTDDMTHVFKCNIDAADCARYFVCSKERLLKMDTGFFGTIPKCVPLCENVLSSRRITERPFNLMKHLDGLEPCRMKNHKTFSAQLVFSQVIGLVHVMAGLRSVPNKRKTKKQEVLPLAMAN